MNCPNCSKEISDTAKVCGYCGTRQAVAPQEELASPPEESSSGYDDQVRGESDHGTLPSPGAVTSSEDQAAVLPTADEEVAPIGAAEPSESQPSRVEGMSTGTSNRIVTAIRLSMAGVAVSLVAVFIDWVYEENLWDIAEYMSDCAWDNDVRCYWDMFFLTGPGSIEGGLFLIAAVSGMAVMAVIVAVLLSRVVKAGRRPSSVLALAIGLVSLGGMAAAGYDAYQIYYPAGFSGGLRPGLGSALWVGGTVITGVSLIAAVVWARLPFGDSE